MKQIASLRFLILLLLVPLTLGQCWAGTSVFPLTVTNFVVSRCDHPFMFGFGSWEKAKTNFAVKPDGIHIAAKDGKGGAGVAGLSAKFPGKSDWTPALKLTAGKKNKATTLNLQLTDGDGTSHAYRFDLRTLTPGKPQQVTAEYGASLAEPQNVEKPGTTPGLDGVASYLVVGNWSDEPVEVVLAGI